MQRTRKEHDRKPPVCCVDTLVLVPDHFSQSTPRWYKNLQAQIPNKNVHLLQMPNPYESNTKRWESVWLGVIRESTQQASGKVCLLGHGSGADACLRFLENDSVESGVVLLAPTGDEYFAGERHGRSYYWDLVRSHVGAGIVLAPSATLNRTERQSLVKNLMPTLVYNLRGDMERFVNDDRADEVAKLIRCACAVETS